MKLSSASKRLATAGRGGVYRSSADRNAALGRGMPQQARAQATDNIDSFGTSTEKPMPMDVDGYHRIGHSYKGESPWSTPPTKDSDATFFHSVPIDNAAPHMRQFAGTINLGFFSSEKTSVAKSTYLSY
jgi:hypothetical protein